jgi:hypothetical protein
MLIKSLPLLLVAAATTAFACEMDCRKGVAGDLAKVYTPVLEKSVDNLESSLTSSIQKVAIPAVITSDATEEDVNAIIEDSIKSTLKTFVSFATDEKRLANGIYRVLFTEELPYKGDCNHPARLTRKMPPDGESWTLDECKLNGYIYQDYLLRPL